MKLLLILLLVFPLTATALCESEEILYANSVDLYVKTKELNETSKRLFKQKKLTVAEIKESFALLKRTLVMVSKSQQLYYECKARTMV